MRSPLRVRAFTSSMPGVSVPVSTLRKLMRPCCGSFRVLKTKATGRSSSDEILSVSPSTSGISP